MSTTHIQPLPNVRGRMSYTELGEGKKRTRNIREKTTGIAAQMGDMAPARTSSGSAPPCAGRARGRG